LQGRDGGEGGDGHYLQGGVGTGVLFRGGRREWYLFKGVGAKGERKRGKKEIICCGVRAGIDSFLRKKRRDVLASVLAEKEASHPNSLSQN